MKFRQSGKPLFAQKVDAGASLQPAGFSTWTASVPRLSISLMQIKLELQLGKAIEVPAKCSLVNSSQGPVLISLPLGS